MLAKSLASFRLDSIFMLICLLCVRRGGEKKLDEPGWLAAWLEKICFSIYVKAMWRWLLCGVVVVVVVFLVMDQLSRERVIRCLDQRHQAQSLAHGDASLESGMRSIHHQVNFLSFTCLSVQASIIPFFAILVPNGYLSSRSCRLH